MPLTLPLSGLRIVDLTRYTVGPYCTRVLADYGAEVVKVEPPAGDPARHLPPFFNDQPGPDRSGLFLSLNTSKQSVVLDLHDRDGVERCLDLIATADAVVENFKPGVLDALGLGYAVLAKINPRIVLTSITNFGQSGPYRDWEATDLTLYALGGPMMTTGVQGHPPVKVAGRWAGYHVGYVAALATVVALRSAEQRGEGEHVDLSAFEALTHSVERSYPLQAYQYGGRVATRASLAAGVASGVFPCADGYVLLAGATLKQVPLIAAMIGAGAILERPEWQVPTADTDAQRIEEFLTYLLPWTLAHTRREIRDELDRRGIFGAPINSVGELFNDPSFVEREFFHTIDHPETGPLKYPGWQMRLHSDEGAMPARRRAPLLGEHTAEILGALPRERAPGRRRKVADARMPLEGVRVLDITAVWAGPYATMHLADWGAEVLRIESRYFSPHNTRSLRMHVTRESVAANPVTAANYPDRDPGADPWNRYALFNMHARGKRSVTLDLTRPEGQEQFERLVEQADGLVENNLPESIERLGITWERLSKVNPRLILVRAPAFGISGPYRRYRTNGAHMEAIVGHPVLRAYPGLSLEYAPTGVPADPASGVAGALALVMGLRYRELTGRGLQIELSTAENMVPLLAEFFMDYAMNGREWSHMGNEHWWIAPHNVYECVRPDTWVAIVARTDDEFATLCRVMGREDLRSDPRFSANAARYKNRLVLDKAISDWTAYADADWIMQRLQREGLPAGAVRTEPALLNDPQHAARGFFQGIDHPSAGYQQHPGRAWRASNTPTPPMRHAPRLGEDNEYVYREILGFDDAQYQKFTESGHIGTDYDDSVP